KANSKLKLDSDWIFSAIEKGYSDKTVSPDINLIEQNLRFSINLEKDEFISKNYINIIPNIIRFANYIKVYMMQDEPFLHKEIDILLNEYILNYMKRDEGFHFF